MLIYDNISHLIITYIVRYFNPKLLVMVPFCWIFSVVFSVLGMELLEPPSNIRPDGEAQLECQYLIMRIIMNTELTRTVGNIRANATQVIELIFISKITSDLAG